MPTRHQTLLIETITEKYGHLPVEKLLAKLCETGVIDHTRCKVLAVRRTVDQLVKRPMAKVDAMQQAADQCCVSYEYVRKCMYHYNDVNL